MFGICEEAKEIFKMIIDMSERRLNIFWVYEYRKENCKKKRACNKPLS